MNAQGTVFIVFVGILAFFAGMEDYMMVLPIALGVINGYVNKRMIDKFKVGKVYHTVQWLVLIVIMGILIWTKVVAWDEALFMTMMYWIPFEMTVNLLRGNDYDYIGENSWTDQLVRRNFATYGLARTFLTILKIVLTFTGFTIYMWDKPL